MRTRRWLATAIVGLLFMGCAAVSTAPAPEAVASLAPTGKLRVGLLLGDATQVIRDSAGEMKGVGFDLGRELARGAQVPFEPIPYPSIGALLDGGKSGAWDVALIGFTPARAKEWEFAAPHLEVQFGYLVPSGSPISTMADADRPGVRIAVQERSGPDAFLSSSLKNAVGVRAPNYAGTLELLKAGKADAIFSIKPILFELSSQLPGSRVLDDSPGTVPQAMAMPKGRSLGIAYARRFVEEAKHKGLVKAAVERAGLRGVVVPQ